MFLTFLSVLVILFLPLHFHSSPFACSRSIGSLTLWLFEGFFLLETLHHQKTGGQRGQGICFPGFFPSSPWAGDGRVSLMKVVLGILLSLGERSCLLSLQIYRWWELPAFLNLRMLHHSCRLPFTLLYSQMVSSLKSISLSLFNDLPAETLIYWEPLTKIHFPPPISHSLHKTGSRSSLETHLNLRNQKRLPGRKKKKSLKCAPSVFWYLSNGSCCSLF